MTTTLPDITLTTPKVSVFEYTGKELIKASKEQADKYLEYAMKKVGIMQTSQEAADPTNKFTPCVIQNASSVRLVDGRTHQLAGDILDGKYYKAPAVIEPGECASFLAQGERGKITYEVQVFESQTAGWKDASPAIQFHLKYEKDLKCNDTVNLVNQYSNEGSAEPNAGYLISRGTNDHKNYNVQTSPNPVVDNSPLGTWMIKGATPNDTDDPPRMYDDKIQLVDQYGDQGKLPYLSIKTTPIDNLKQVYPVQASPGPDPDNGTTTWQIVQASSATGASPVKNGDKIHLINQYSNATNAHPNAGYLDTFGWSGKQQEFGVRTSSESNRDDGSGTWQIILIPVEPLTASVTCQDESKPQQLDTTLTWISNSPEQLKALPTAVFKLTQSVVAAAAGDAADASDANSL